jgi:hypothetical protein
MITTTIQVLNVIYHPMQIKKEGNHYIWHLLTSSQMLPTEGKTINTYMHIYTFWKGVLQSSKKHKQSSLKIPCINFINSFSNDIILGASTLKGKERKR